jgi:small-conductance mechanosensitive channel
MGRFTKTVLFLKQLSKTQSFHDALKSSLLAIILYSVIYVFGVISDNFLSLLFQIGLWYALIEIILSIIRSIMLTAYRVKYNYEYNHYDNYTAAIIHILTAAKLFVLFAVFLSIFNIKITQFLTSISIVAVALVLIFKEHITNLVNGVAILFSQAFQIDDFVQIGDMRGKIKDINLQYVVIKNDKGQATHIPNAIIFTKDVINISQSEDKFIQTKLVLQTKIPFSEFKEEVEKLLPLKLIAQNIETKSTTINIESIDKDNYTVGVHISVNTFTLSKERKIKAIVNQVGLESLQVIMAKQSVPVVEVSDKVLNADIVVSPQISQTSLDSNSSLTPNGKP